MSGETLLLILLFDMKKQLLTLMPLSPDTSGPSVWCSLFFKGLTRLFLFEAPVNMCHPLISAAAQHAFRQQFVFVGRLLLKG